MAIRQLEEFLERLRNERRALEDDAPPSIPPPPDNALWRELRACAPPDYASGHLTVDEARALIAQRIDEYLAMPAPAHMLLIRAAAGVGKTTIGVRTAEKIAGSGRRVGYVAPRHDFWNDVQAIAARPQWWYEWQPRAEGDELRPRTCEHVEPISKWINRGYAAIDFCSAICGWDYVGKRCVWHAQKERREPIIFIQHQHVAGGHPLEFHALIGDENPLQAFLRQWNIPAERVIPRGTADDEPLKEILLKLAGLCAGEIVHGPNLIEQLGGAAEVAEACRLFKMPTDAEPYSRIHYSDEVDRVDYFYLPEFVPLLLREAEAVAAGRDYPHRIVAGKGDLSLLLRRPVDARLPRHVIWLDATGSEHLYAELFGRPVQVVDAQPKLAGRIHVVTDRANGKRDFKSDQAGRLIRAIVERESYQAPAVVTFEAAKAEIAEPDWLTAHFYGARGTNRLEAADALFVAGAPMPAMPVLEKMAAQVYFRRDQAFATLWHAKYIAYNHVAEDGQGREYPAGGYWSDDDLQALVWQMREAEIIQAVHRARPIHRDVDIWLLSNLPIPELPVASLVTAAELLGTPKATNTGEWGRFFQWATKRGGATVPEIVRELGLSENTAIKYRDELAKLPGWVLEVRKSNGRGRSQKAVLWNGEFPSKTLKA